MLRRPQRSNRSDTLFPDPTLFRSCVLLRTRQVVVEPEIDRSFGRKHDLGGWLEIIAEEDAGGRRIAAVVDRGGAKVGLDRAEPILAPARLRPDIGALEGLGRRGRRRADGDQRAEREGESKIFQRMFLSVV